MDHESPGLGSVFLDEVDGGFDRIQTHPDAATEVVSGVRKLVLAKFPYSIVYEVRGAAIHILAVSHQRRRPFHWRKRR